MIPLTGSSAFLCFLFIHVALFPPLGHSLSFSIPRFGVGGNITMDGDATVISYIGTETYIDLTFMLMFHVGRATYSQPLRLWDSRTGILSNFTTTFSFTIFGTNSTDGFAFFMASLDYPIPANSAGGYLGLFNVDTCITGVPNNQIVLVEFDTWSNDEFDDVPKSPHVGININSIVSNVTSTNFDFSSGQQGQVLITYDATSYNLTVCWSFTHVFTPLSCLSYQIDLREFLPEFVVFGFSAATGAYPALHLIHSWDFTSSLNDDHSVVEATETKTRHATKSQTFITAILSATLVLVLGIVVGWFVRDRKRKKFKYKGVSTVELDLDRAAIPRRFYYQELVAATNGFASDTRLGRGGSGQVYKGVLTDLGRTVAVKRIFLNFKNSETIFINEVKIISRLIHKNLVQFIGWCHEGGEFLLVIEYMPNGSLDTHLFGKKPILPWSVRYKVALGVVTAIHYLHEEVEQCVLHRDIKSANILLDTDFCTKLGDFGVALMLVDPSRLRSHEMTGSLVGTYGYLAPEYAKEGKASKESDMYSFGVVALEIACGRRTYHDGEYHVSLVNWVWQHYVEGTIVSVADEGLGKDGFDEKEMECLLIVGLWCTNPKDKERPRAEQVIKALRHEAKLPVIPKDMHDLSASSPSVAHYNSHQSQPITTSLSNIGR